MPNADSIKFKHLRLEGWRQFDLIDIELHPTLTVITGANGAGKSTILNLFSQHFGYSRQYLATPIRDPISGGYRYESGVNTHRTKTLPPPPTQVVGDTNHVGYMTYTNGSQGHAFVPQHTSIQHGLGFSPQSPVQGFHVPSHRKLPNYQQVSQIPTQPMLPAQAYSTFNSEMMNHFQGSHTNHSPMYRIKEALLSMAVFGPGNKNVEPNEVLETTYDGFVEILRLILPPEIGFLSISFRTPDVMLRTTSGEFLIDAASGGLISLIDLSWQIYMFSRLAGESFSVTIDEPENHLHPSMQRSLMASLIKAFPRVQFIVATHSPFIVSATRDAHVIVLRHHMRPENEDSGDGPIHTARKFVSSMKLDAQNRAGSASQILRDVLGMETTYPQWAINQIADLIARHAGKEITEETVTSIRNDLAEIGATELFPEALSELAKS